MLALRNVHSGYGGIRVLEGISIEVKTGEMVSLLGANASGKSTTLKTIMGYVRPTQGSIALDGQRIDHLRTDQIVRRGITMVPENRRVFPELTVHENLLCPANLLIARDDEGSLESGCSDLRAMHERAAGKRSCTRPQIFLCGGPAQTH